MNRIFPSAAASAAIQTPDRPDNLPEPNLAVMRLRGVHRAIAELRRGTPVLLTGDAPLLLLAAETASAATLTEMIRLADGPAVLLLAPMRAAAVLQRPVPQNVPAVALSLSPSLLAPETLLSLADPTVEQMLPDQPVPTALPALAQGALVLVKLARLLPAVLAAPAGPGALEAAASLQLLHVPASDVLLYPNASAIGLRPVAEAEVPLRSSEHTRIVAFRAPDAGIEHLAILVGRPEDADLEGNPAPLVRIHSECFTGDLLDSLRCDCGQQLRGAIARMAEDGAGVLLYLAQEGRGIGLVNKLRAYTLQDRGLDTLDANRALGWGADERNFMVAATMLDSLGIRRIRLLTNNPDKIAALAACGVQIEGREAHSFAPNGVNDQYLATKAERFGHMLD
jgi:GTP cyclohydrolase II